MVLNRIGITGATGMLGRHVRAALEAAGAHVVATSREAVPENRVAGWNLSHWRSVAELDALFNEVQAVIHVGATVPRTPETVDEALMFDANVRSCVNLGQWMAARNIPLVHVSGAIVYEDQDHQGMTESATLGWNGLGGFYGLSKLLAEDVLRRLCPQGLKLAIVRPSSIYGLGLPEAKMLTSFLAAARSGHSITLTPPVDDRINFIHATDVALAILEILKHEAWDIFNLASRRAVTVEELAEACIASTGRGSVVIKEGHGHVRKPFARFMLDTDRARIRLNWQPLIDISQGLSMMLKGRLYSP